MSAPTIERPAVKAEHFKEAAQLIREGGLAKTAYVLPVAGQAKASYCTVGALRTAITGSPHNSNPTVDRAVDFLAVEVLGADFGDKVPCDCGVIDSLHFMDGTSSFNLVTDHNDRDDVTQDDIVALLEQAGEKVSQQ